MLFFVDHSTAGGGVETLLRALMVELKGLGWIVHIAFAKGGEPGTAFEADSVHLFRRKRILFSFLDLARLMQRLKPDLVVPSYEDPALLTYLASSLLFPRAKLISIVHAHLDSQLRSFGFLGRTIRRGLIHLVFPKLQGVIAVSQSIEDDLRKKHFPCGKPRIIAIQNAVDRSVLDKSKAPSDAPKRLHAQSYFLVVSRLSKQKRVDHAIDAFSRVAGECSLDLAIVGKGELEDELRSQARALGIHERVHFLGYLENPFPVMAAAKALVHTASYEGFGMVLVEAMTLGVPVLAFDCPVGPRECLGGEAGILVPYGDIATFAHEMLRISRDPSLNAQLSASGVARSKHFDIALCASKYDSFFRLVLSQG